MFELISKLFSNSKESSSRDQANERLRFVLAYDRSDINSELMETLKEDIIQVIAKYFEISGMPEVKLINEKNHSALDINIIIKGRPVNSNDYN